MPLTSQVSNVNYRYPIVWSAFTAWRPKKVAARSKQGLLNKLPWNQLERRYQWVE